MSSSSCIKNCSSGLMVSPFTTLGLICVLSTEDLKFATEDLQDDEVLVLEIVKLDGLGLKHASPRLRKARHVVLAALESDTAQNEKICLDILMHAHKDLQEDDELIAAARGRRQRSHRVTILHLFYLFHNTFSFHDSQLGVTTDSPGIFPGLRLQLSLLRWGNVFCQWSVSCLKSRIVLAVIKSDTQIHR